MPIKRAPQSPRKSTRGKKPGRPKGVKTKRAASTDTKSKRGVRKSTGAKGEKKKGPKRPTSAYIFFAQERRKQLIEKEPALKSNVPEVAKRLGVEWKSMAESAKHKYEQMAQKDRTRYENEKAKAK